jgi:hypothetical protein
MAKLTEMVIAEVRSKDVWERGYRAYALRSRLRASQLVVRAFAAFRFRCLRFSLATFRASLAASRRGLFPEAPPPPLFTSVHSKGG